MRYCQAIAGRPHTESNDCSVVALTIACNTDYLTAQNALSRAGRVHGKGVNNLQIACATNLLGYGFSVILHAPKGITCNNLETYVGAWNHGNWLAFTNGHVLAVTNGKVQDWTEGRKFKVTSLLRVESFNALESNQFAGMTF